MKIQQRNEHFKVINQLNNWNPGANITHDSSVLLGDISSDKMQQRDLFPVIIG